MFFAIAIMWNQETNSIDLSADRYMDYIELNYTSLSKLSTRKRLNDGMISNTREGNLKIFNEDTV